MFWRMTGLATTSPVETVLDRENFTLEELLDEDEIIQECKALNGRLINYLQQKPTIKQLINYIVEEPREDAERQQRFKFSFIACEIFTCEVDAILKSLVEDEELMGMLFSFLDPDRLHSNLMAGYFSKVVVGLHMRKISSLMNYIQGHQDIIKKLVDLIGITSIMEVLIRLSCADDAEYMPWLEEINIPEMLVDKFGSSDCPEVHANAAETLCAIARYASLGLANKISSPSFIDRLFHHALEESRPKSVLVNLLSVCISLLDPKRLPSGAYYMYARQTILYSGTSANTITVQGMLENLGGLLKLLDISLEDDILITTFGMLKPPLGKHRLKIAEFISVLLAVGNEAVEKELILLDAIKHLLDLFFQYPFNNFLHHHVERILLSCMESTNSQVVEYLLHQCNLVERILAAEKCCTLAFDIHMPSLPIEGRKPPRIGNIGHLTRIANKLVQLANSNSEIQSFLQENSDWVAWQTNVLIERNALENVSQWTCGRPSTLHDRVRDSDDDDYQDRDYDVAALANNMSQAFKYRMYSNYAGEEEVHNSIEGDDEDMYFDDDSAEVVISSLHLGEDHDGGYQLTLSTSSEERVIVDEVPDSMPLPSPSPLVHEEVGAVIVDQGPDSMASPSPLVHEEVDTATVDQTPDSMASPLVHEEVGASVVDQVQACGSMASSSPSSLAHEQVDAAIVDQAPDSIGFPSSSPPVHQEVDAAIVDHAPDSIASPSSSPPVASPSPLVHEEVGVAIVDQAPDSMALPSPSPLMHKEIGAAAQNDLL